MFRDRRRVALSRRDVLAQLAGATVAALWNGSALGQRAPVGRGEFGLWSPLAFGARGDGVANDTAALQRTIDACAWAGGGTVVLPGRHVFVSGSLELASDVELHLAASAVLEASGDRDEFRKLGALLFAKDARNVRISGTGTIDGNFSAFFPPKGPNGYAIPSAFLGPYDPLYPASARNPKDGRPRMILLAGCRNTELVDFTIRDSPTWTIHPIGCDGLQVSGISILNNLEIPNCDGIDVDHCRNVRIEDCNIVAGDDCLVLKASRNFGEYGPCEGITITNCTLESSSAGIKIGNEGPYALRSAVVSNCTIVRTNRGVSLTNRDGELVEDLIFSDMTIETRMRSWMWWGSGEPVFVSAGPRMTGAPVGTFRGIQFANLECRSESGIYLRGTREMPLRDISLRGVDLRIEKTTEIEGGFYDVRPDDTPGASGLDKRAIAGVFAADVSGLALSDVRVAWGAKAPSYYGAAVELHSCSEVAMRSVTGGAAHAGAAATVFDDVQMATELGPGS
jgi:hypothetical protein